MRGVRLVFPFLPDPIRYEINTVRTPSVRWARPFAARGLEPKFALCLPFGVLSGQLAPLGGSYSGEEPNPSPSNNICPVKQRMRGF